MDHLHHQNKECPESHKLSGPESLLAVHTRTVVLLVCRFEIRTSPMQDMYIHAGR